MTILPAIIPKDFEDLENHLVQVRGLVRSIQIDICDGRLTPSPSWPFIHNFGELEEVLKQQRGLPLWEHFDFEFDLMVQNPAKEYERWIDAGATRLIFHYKESDILVLQEIMQKTKERNVEVGLALHIGDSIDAIGPFKELIDVIQFMGILKIGFQGEPFDERVLEKIKKTKEIYPHIPIGVDGGVNRDTAPLIVEAGATRLVVGSALFGDVDLRETIGYFGTLS